MVTKLRGHSPIQTVMQSKELETWSFQRWKPKRSNICSEQYRKDCYGTIYDN